MRRVFDLKAGEISPVYSDPAALYIYKVVSVRQVPMSEVKTQISQTLQRQMYNDKLEEIQKAVTPELNDAYFGPETAPAAMPRTCIPACRRVRVRRLCRLRQGRPRLQQLLRLRRRQEARPTSHGRESKCPGHRSFREFGNQAASFSEGVSCGGRGYAPTRRILDGQL